jgi:hypothetical protein
MASEPTSHRWSVDDVAEFLGLAVDEVRDLVNAGFLHPEEIARETSFDAEAVKAWRRGLDDQGSRGAAYVRELLANLEVMESL